jgi:hypothetical protein
MKKILLIMSCILLTGCESKEEIESDISRLRKTRNNLTDVIVGMNNQIRKHSETIEELKSDREILELYQQGADPRYILTLELKQSHFTMDIGTHIKDDMNAIRFDVPVDRAFYQDVNINQNIVEEFRNGSFFMKGSFGKWRMKVVGKRIVRNHQ